MPFDFKMTPETYEVVFEEYIDEVKSNAALLKHRKTGAKVVVLSNDDNNKVFNIGFRTPPTDSTGVAHIMEHTVLCGSEKFPAKDPFVELCKGSLNTFLNAMTYPDKTIYPVASYNDADFQNLMHVYLDAVFHPNIYLHSEIFRQEGWHYELEDAQAPLIYNGVVYNEMKGAFSSPDDVLTRKIMETLFPDTIYGVESGGDPVNIPDLTYEAYLDFHRRYYHPSNSYIYLYGDMDVAEKLSFIDQEYLSAYDFLEIDSSIAPQAPFEGVRYFEDNYPVSEQDEVENAAYMAYNWVIGSSLDPETCLGFKILEYVLMEAPGAPLKQALLNENLGEDIYGSYETSMLQPYLSIVIKNMNPKDRDRIVHLINMELAKLADGDLNRETIQGALNYFEFKSRESDFGRWPKGLMWGLQLLDSWLYDEKAPFIHLKYKKLFESLNAKLDKGYFEDLIQHWMLDNDHASVLVLKPERGLATKNEEALAEKLEAYKAGLSEEEIQQLIEDTKALRAYQAEPSPKEVIEMIPLLSIDDIKKEAEPLINEAIETEHTFMLYHDIETNGIDYVQLIFDIRKIEAEMLPYASLLGSVLGDVDTKTYTYQQINDEMNLNTGGIRTNISFYGTSGTETFKPAFEFTGKVLDTKLPKMMALIESMIFETDFMDDKRIKEILNQIKSRQEMSMMNAGHSVSVNRAISYYNEGAWYKELTEGIAYYQFICDLLKNYDEKKAEMADNFRRLMIRIFRPENMMVDWTAEKSALENAKATADAFAQKLYTEPLTEAEQTQASVGLCKAHNEAFTTAGMVQYCAASGNFTDAGIRYHGGMNILRNIMGNEYLWNNIRVQGGAYGCMCNFGLTGNAYFVSYRDPNIGTTYDVYEKAADYVASLDLDERELTKYMIGAVSTMDIPMTPSMKGARSLAAYLAKRSFEEIQKTRDELLATDNETLRSFAPAVKAIMDAGHICVVGSESSVNKEKERFESIEALLR